MKPDYPTVTQIIRPYLDTTWFDAEAAARGTAVHEAARCYLMGLFIPPLEPDRQPYFDSFRRWTDEMVVETVLIEERLFDHRLRFSGEPDLVARLKGDEGLSLIDWKTGVGGKKGWSIQIAAYRHLAKVDRGIDTFRGLSVRLKKNGSKAIPKPYPADYRRRYNIFLGLLNAWHFFNK